jgi:hypothetical protein
LHKVRLAALERHAGGNHLPVGAVGRLQAGVTVPLKFAGLSHRYLLRYGSSRGFAWMPWHHKD